MGDFPGCGAIRQSFRDSDHYPYIQPPSHVLVTLQVFFPNSFSQPFSFSGTFINCTAAWFVQPPHTPQVHTGPPESIHGASCKSSAASTPYKSRQSLSQGPKPLTTHKHYLYDIPESHNSKERDNPTVRYGGREGVIYGQFGGPPCRWAVCPQEGCNGEETEAASLDKPRRTIGLFECRRQGQRDHNRLYRPGSRLVPSGESEPVNTA